MQPKPMVLRAVLSVLASLVAVACLLPSASAHQIAQQAAPAQAPTPIPNRISLPIDESSLTTLKGNTHPLARPEFDRGAAPGSLPLNRMLLVLTRSQQQETALEVLLDQQQDKTSPNYHSWLTADQFGQQFGPSDQDIQAVTSWLQSRGFTVSRVSKGRTVIEFSGSAAQVQQAFHTGIHKYTVDSEDHWANSSDPQIPAALAPVVAGLASLNNFPANSMNVFTGTFRREKSTGKVTPLKTEFTFPIPCSPTSQPFCTFGVGPNDFATIYSVPPLGTAADNGTGQAIAIVAETDINPQDFADFHTLFGLAASTLNVIHDGPDPGIVADESEADIDTQWSSAVAPGATIDFVVSGSTETTLGVHLSAEYIVDNNLAPVMSESYGICELGLGASGNQFFSQMWQQAAAQGISVFVSSGDQGSAVCDRGAKAAQFGLQVNGFASTPYNVAVGGTDFNDLTDFTAYWNLSNNSTTQSSAISYIPEMTWNDSCTNSEIFRFFGVTTAEELCNNPNAQNDGFLNTAAGSGGVSVCTTPSGLTASSCSGGYPKPSWQKGAGVPSNPPNNRDLPDVSLFSSNGFNGSFYIVCQQDVTNNTCDLNAPYQDFAGFGGTSVASPAFAGIMALINQKYGRQGNANYMFYSLANQAGKTCTSAANPGPSCVFYDIPAGSTIAVPCITGSTNCSTTNAGDAYGVLTGYSTTAGYDLATGLGSVNVKNLVADWPQGSFAASATTIVSLSPTSLNHGASANVSINVKAQSGTAVPTGLVSLIADAGPSGEQAVASFALTSSTCSGSPCAIATGSTNLLPGGSNYKIFARYPGDSTFAPSDSATQQVTVNPESSKTQLGIVTFSPTTGQVTSSNATSFPYGSPYILRSDITNSSASLCFNSTTKALAYACPTGTVTFTDNGAALGSSASVLNAQGYTEYLNIQLTGGNHTLAGSYSGDSSYNASSGSDAVTVTPAPTTTTISSFESSSPLGIFVIGQSFSFSAQSSTQSSGVAPTGTYVFFDGANQLTGTTPATISAYGYAGSSTSTASATGGGGASVPGPSGAHTITAHYSGDTNYASSVSPSMQLYAVYGTTMSVTATPTNIVYGQAANVSVTATLSTGNPASNAALKPTGTISFSSSVGAVSGNPTTTVSQDSNGNWIIQSVLTTNPQQSEAIYANYPGDSNYAASGNSAGVNVTIPDFAVSAGSPSLVVAAGQTGTATLTITPTTSYTSTVTLSCGSGSGIPGANCSINPASVTLSNGASATATVSISTLAPSSGTSAMNVPADTPLLPFNAQKPGDWLTIGVFGSLISVFVMLVPGQRRPRSVAIGCASIALMAFAIGCGGGSGGGGQSGPVPSITKLSVATTKSPQNVGVNATATVSASDSPTGTVIFDCGNCSFDPTVALTSGTAQAQIGGFLGPGTYIYSAKYGGDTGTQPSQSGTLNIVFTGSVSVGITGQTSVDAHTAQLNVTIQ